MTYFRRFFCCLIAFLACRSQAQTPRDFAVDLSATVSTNAPCITLSWSIRRQSNIIAQKIHRRLKGETSWIKQADLTTNQTSFADSTATPGVEYEYWMERTYSGLSPTTAMGYLSAGVNVPMTESRGKLLLVIDDTMVVPLAPEIEQLQNDLVGEGWSVQKLTALRTNTAANVKAQIVSAYNADTQSVKMVYLLGHVPVPYSGNMNPDGHSDHVGAWPADGYYGEMNGLWTDSTVYNTSAARSQNDNVPGDGKFDQNYFPNLVELMVGRVDLHSMTRSPASSVSETALLRRYLRKAHDFRMKQGAYASIPRRSLIRDAFGYFSGENFAIAGWAWAFTGAGSLIDEPASDQWFSSAYAGGKTYLVGYGNGSGSYDNASSVGNTADFGLKPSRAVFTSFFGSYFGDWDSDNNLLRAPLAGNATGDSLGLISFWGGRPNRFFHPMGMGETAGYSMRASHNGILAGGGGYTPNNYAGVHSGLMGDPALRLYSVEPPRDLTAVSSNGQVVLAWSLSTETNLLGYHVFRADSLTNLFLRLTASPQPSTSFTDTSVTAGLSYCYQVRTLKRETTPGGSFDNLSAGIPLSITVQAGAAAAPRNPGRLAVTPFSSTNALLTWVDTADSETGFRVERMVNAGGAFTLIATVSANVTNFTDTGVFTNGNVYYYRVVATGAADNSLPSNLAYFDASAGFFDLPATRQKVNKMAGSVAIPVNRIGGSNGIASVNYATSDSSALTGVHYAATNGTLTWSDGETAAKTITVPILNTAAPQAARQFKVSLNTPSSGASTTINSSVAVLIEDASAALDAAWSQTIINGITDSSPAVTISNAICSVTIGGAGVSASSNYEAGQFVYQSKTGDGILTAYFPAGIPADSNARYALMIRANSGNNAVMAAAVTSSSTAHGTKLAYRTTAGSYATTLPTPANALVVARWLRLIRNGSMVSAETSTDGIAWTTVASATLTSLPSSALWGIFHYSSDWSVTTLGNYHLATAENITLADMPPPSAPTGLVATANSPTQVSLTWPTVTYASGYRVERCAETGSFSQIVEVAASALPTQTWADASLSADCGYAYRVCAFNASGSSDYSQTVYVTTPLSDIVTLLTSDGINCADATIQRDLPISPLGLSTNLTVASYDPDTWEMLSNASKVYLRFDLSGFAAPSQTRLRLTFMGSDDFDFWNYFSLYFYLLSSSSNGWSEDSLTWNNAPQNEVSGLGFSEPLCDLGNLYEYTLPSEGQEVFYTLDATALFNNRATNNWVTISMTQYGGAVLHWASKEHPTLSAPALEVSTPSLLPPRPAFLTAEVESGWSVTLRWQNSSSNGMGFELERRVAGGEFALLQNLASNTLGFVDTATLPSTTYEYRLRAFNGNGPSSWTPVASATTPDVFSAAGTLWDGGGADTDFSTSENWDKDRTPAFDGTAYYNFGSGGSCATVNTNAQFLGMSIHRDADFLFADGGATITLGAGGLRAVAPSSVSRVYTVAAGLALAADQRWGVTNTGAGTTALVISGPVSDGAASFGIAKSGSGLITLAGASDYDGTTTVAAGGGIAVAHNNGLGSAVGCTEVASNAWMEISGNVTVPEPLTLRDASSAGALRATAGSNVWSGPVTLAAPTRLRALAGSRLTLSGGVSGSSDLLLSPDEGGELGFTGAPISIASRKISALGEGSITIASANNTYGTLEVTGAGMRLRLGATNALSPSSVLSVGASYSAAGLIDLNGFDQTVARLVRGTTATVTNRIVTSSAPATLTVNETSGSAIYFNGYLTGALGLTKGGSGYLSLTGINNTFTGTTTVNGGTLEVGASARLGFSPRVTVTGGTLRLLNTNAISDSAVLNIADGGTAKVRIDTGAESVGMLVLGGIRQASGTWGANGSGAENIDNVHFAGTGKINVLNSAVNTTPTWDAEGANTSLTTAENWDLDAPPALNGTSYVIFGLGGSIATMNTNASFARILLNRSADFTFADGGGTLGIGPGGLAVSGPADASCLYTIASKVSLNADQNWGVTNNGMGSTTLLVSGPISDGASCFGIAKTGSGILALTGDSDYDGPTSVDAYGGLRVGHNNALGSVSNGTAVASNGWIEVVGSVTVPESLTLGDACTAGALRSTAGTNIWSGSIMLTAPTRLRASAGSRLTLAGGISGASDLLLSTGEGGELAVSGCPISLSSRKITAFGEGTVTIASGGHTFTTLEVAGTGMRLHLEAPNVLPSSCILSVGANYSAAGIVDLNGFNQTVARLVRGTTASVTNRIVTSSEPATLTVNETSSSAIYFNGYITGALGLTKGNNGYLSLTGTNNTFTGATTVNSGTLEIGSNSRLGFSTRISVNGGTLKLLNANALSDEALLSIATGGKVYLLSGSDTVSALYLGGKRQLRGTYGSSASGATYKSDTYFSSSGTGVIKVLHGPECILFVK